MNEPQTFRSLGRRRLGGFTAFDLGVPTDLTAHAPLQERALRGFIVEPLGTLGSTSARHHPVRCLQWADRAGCR
jgi:hypothetical protein